MALLELSIRNFILVKSVHLQFDKSLNIITGETGAGKSLLVGAINLLIGYKVDWELVSGENKAEIIGIFESTPQASAVLEDAGIEADDEIIIRRTLDPSKRKSRAFVNSVPVTQQFLRSLAGYLIDIHGQHEHQSLFNTINHLLYLDNFAHINELKEEFQEKFRELLDIQRQLRSEQEEVENIEKVREFLEFQLKEIEELSPEIGEDEKLQEQIKVLSNLETLRSGILESLNLLYDEDESIYSKLVRVRNALGELIRIDDRLREDSELVDDLIIKIEELWRNLLDYSKNLDSDPGELDRLMERLSKINRLKEKYKMDIKGLLELAEETRSKLSKLEVRDELLEKLWSRVKEKEREVEQLAEKLSQMRKSAAREFEKLVMDQLQDLGMGGARFIVHFEDKELDSTGKDYVEFLISTNPGEEPKPLRKIASGGELSRIMLALKTVLSDVDDIPTLIFDEIDVGIGGRIAEAVGKKLSQISTKRQIIAITHLPQIAVYGDRHFIVEKLGGEESVETHVRALNQEERVGEIARMLAGEKITDSSLLHASELLRTAGKLKNSS